MDLSNLNPAVGSSDTKTVEKENNEQANINIPLSEEATPIEGTDLTARVITDEEEIKKIEANKNLKNIMIDAVTRTTAQMRLEACENDVTLDSVYNTRLETTMANDKLDEKGFELAKQVLDSAFGVAKELGVPDKDDTETIFLLAKVATGEMNPREEMDAVKLKASNLKRPSMISKKERSKRRQKNKAAKKARRKGRK